MLYTGVTNDLKRRMAEHRRGEGSHFVARYRAHRLVYYEAHEEAYSAIQREKQLKAGSRRKKMDLVDAANPSWRDLAASFDALGRV